MNHTDILIIGGGAAGMAAAAAAAADGVSVLLAEQEESLGGILNRCVHHGFGLGYYEEDLTGQEYADRYRRTLRQYPVTVRTGTTVTEIRPDRTALLSSRGTLEEVSFRILILASGSYERPSETIPVAGTRPAGVMTAGCAQGLINEDSLDIGERIVILGSGNVGQIMARQFVQADKTVLAMVEQAPSPGGLARNRRECLEEWHIPLLLNSTVTRIHGNPRISGVTVRNLLSGEEQFLACDTLITALGLIPERDVIRPLLQEDGGYPSWILLAGNCDQIYDFADAVTAHGEDTGRTAARLCRA